MLVLAWAVSILYLVATGLSIPLAAFALAISPAKGRTLKRILLVFIPVAAGILFVGLFTAAALHSHAVSKLTGMFFIPGGMLTGAIAGLIHARTLRKSGSDFPSISIRG